MNQPNLSVMTPKPAAVAADAPDLLGMLKRYVWLLVAGAVLGAGASGGYYYYAARYRAQYTAHVPFQVLTPQPTIGTSEIQSVPMMSLDDTSQVIHRQEFWFQQERFLTDVLKSQEFHTPQPGQAGTESGWLMEHKSDPLKYLRRDLVVVPRINAASFEVTMAAHDPMEAYTLVQAAVKVYMQRLQSDVAKRQTAYLKKLLDAVTKAESTYQIKTDALLDYSKRKGVDVLKSRFDIEKNALQGLNDDYTRADAAASGAEQQYESIKKTKADGKEIQLSSDLAQSIENDWTIKTLMNTRLNWEQEKAAELTRRSSAAGGAAVTTASPATSAALAAIDARIKTIDEQSDETRKKLTADARDRLEKLLADEAVNKRFLANYIGQIRKAKEDIVTGIGQDLLDWQKRVDDLKEQQDLVAKLHSQYNLADANRATDDTRVQQIDEPVVPGTPSWPKWYMFIPLGTVAGLGLSALLAYLFVLTDTRVRTPRDISRTLQLPLLGFIPDESDDRILSGDVETAILSSPASMIAESFRQIRGHITAQTAHNPVNTLVVASIGPGGGATTVASNLASAMALNDLRVLLIDANFYRPSLGRIYKDLPKEGLTDAVADPSLADSCITPHPGLPRLHVMGVGTLLAGASSEVFESKAFRELLEHLKSKYDMVIFDGAPLNLVADSLALASRVDGVVSVVRAGEVSRGAVSRVRDQMRSVHANLLGFVLNAAQTSNTGYFKETYRSFYKYAGQSARSRPQ